MTAVTTLSADVGGTKTLLRLSRFSSPTSVELLAEERYISAEWAGLAELVSHFLSSAAIDDDRKRPTAACFAIAGPIEDHTSYRTARLTNLDWLLDSRQLCPHLSSERILIINDFEAIGYAVNQLAEAGLHTLQPGRPVSGSLAVVAGAGTGLGVSILLPEEGDYRPSATEGGHVDFAPTDEIQVALLHFLQQRFSRVSTERLLSGAGLASLVEFISLHRPTPSPLASLIDNGEDPAAVITQAAIEHNDPFALEVTDLFCKLYGAFAGNLALTTLPFGGLFLAGGIAPKILPLLKRPPFLEAFHDKGRMEPLLHNVPVHVIQDPKAGLLGAEQAALRLARTFA